MRLVSARQGLSCLAGLVMALAVTAGDARAQTGLTVASDVVTPGATVSVTVTGPAGQHFAVIGSSVGAGVSYGGIALGVGGDFVILAQGVLDGTGQAVVGVRPPFMGSLLDRYYLQGASSPSPAFIPLSVSPGRVVRNADVVAGLPGAPGPTGPAGPAGPAGPVGPAGPAGSAGPAGPAGPAGATGPAGSVGPAGPVGPMGSTGPAGPVGAMGPQGATGPQGPVGAQGPAGPVGATGAQGPAGAVGATGAQGPQGPAGVVATNGTGAFNFANNNGFVAPGTLGAGQIAATGAGLRMLWYPRKGAFRAGQVIFDQWDDGFIGNFSVAMGQNTRATGASSVVLGDSSSADGAAGVALGASNHAMGNNSVALGFASTASQPTSFAMGHGALASGRMSVAMGTLADTNLRDGAFVYGDRSTLEVSGAAIQATAHNEFAVRAAGGFRFRTSADLSTGCNLPASSGTFSCTSSRSTKHRFQDVNGEDLLARLRAVPVSTWSYRHEEGGVRHMGPMAEDFRAALGLGVNEVSIGLQDIDGVNLAAVQALIARTDALIRQNAEQAARIQALEAALACGVRSRVASGSPQGCKNCHVDCQ